MIYKWIHIFGNVFCGLLIDEWIGVYSNGVQWQNDSDSQFRYFEEILSSR